MEIQPTMFEVKRTLYDEFRWFVENKVLIGGDPEVMGFRDEFCLKEVFAQEVVDDNVKEVMYRGVLLGRVGRDGNPKIYEVRPTPSKDPVVLLAKYALLLRDGGYKLNRISSVVHTWDAGYEKLPLGGHIHIGGEDVEMCEFLTKNSGRIVSLLNSNYELGHLFYALSTVVRRRSKYLLPEMSFEPKPWGFEYRTPPASIWTEPRLFIPIVTLVLLVVFKEYTLHHNSTIHDPLKNQMDRAIHTTLARLKERRRKMNNKRINLKKPNELKIDYTEWFLKALSEELGEDVKTLDKALENGHKLYLNYTSRLFKV